MVGTGVDPVTSRFIHWGSWAEILVTQMDVPPGQADSPVVGTGVDPVTSRFSGRIWANLATIG